MISGEIRIRKQMRAKIGQGITNPTHHMQVQGMMRVAHQPVETFVA
jgi:hypothetical protein